MGSEDGAAGAMSSDATVIDGGGAGTPVSIDSPGTAIDVRLFGLRITGSGGADGGCGQPRGHRDRAGCGQVEGRQHRARHPVAGGVGIKAAYLPTWSGMTKAISVKLRGR